jgi:enoyl-CoA hydratase/carnithine racemase
MSSLIVEQHGPVKRLILNRPDKRNALDLTLADSLLREIGQAAHDDTRLIVLQGNGPGFCAGFDFSDLDTATAGDLLLQFVRIEQMLQAVAHSPVDTLAMAHGHTIGAGADLLVACRHRIGAADTQIRFPGAQFGLILGSRRLAQCTGADVAQGLIGSSEKVPASAAHRFGLLSEIVDQADWPERERRILAQVSLVSAGTRAKVLSAMRPDTRAQDLADLADSASRADIKQRIMSYLQQGRARSLPDSASRMPN